MRKLLTFFFFILTHLLLSQDTVLLQSYLEDQARRGPYEFYFKEGWIDSVQIDRQDKDALENIRRAVLNVGLKVYVHQEKYVFIYPNRIEFEKQGLIDDRAKLGKNIEDIRIGDPTLLESNEAHFLSGIISNEAGDRLAGVNISIDGELRAKTNESGRYSIELEPGNYQIDYSFVGLENESRLVTFYSSGEVSVSLFSNNTLLDEVVVEGVSNGSILELKNVGAQKISINSLEKLPSVSGNLDVIKGANALPGVSVSGESSSYLNIRGGGNDQTLLLMNNATIYNPGHLLGFFSVYNGDFVSDLTLYKGNIPAKYGVRASSVLDVKMNKWGAENLNIYGGIGIANSNLGVKKKFFDDKVDVHIGGRISHLNWILDLVPNEDILNSEAGFNDINLVARYKASENSTFMLSSFLGNDLFKYSNQVVYDWQTLNNSLKWIYLLDSDWILETELSNSQLRNSSEGLTVNDEFLFENGLNEYGLKSSISNEKFSFGIDLAKFDFELGTITPTRSNSLVAAKTLENETALSAALHADYNFRITENLSINPGLRFNAFYNLGSGTLNKYRANAPLISANVVDIESFDDNELIHARTMLEPRLGINYRVNKHWFRAGYSRLNQLIHLISNTMLVNPSTTWKASDKYISPTTIDQYSVGYEYALGQGITVSVDGFYKSLTNMVDYRNGADLVLNDDLEQAVLLGNGESYGAELLLSKSGGQLNGLVSYTYSRSFIRIDDPAQGELINNGEKYPFYSDRPHNLKSSLNYKLTSKWTVSSNFTYVTGAPISAPISNFEVDGVVVPFFSDRNSERIPDYHRLDLVFTLKSRIRKTKKNNDRWVLTLYNVYGRDNVATIFFANQGDTQTQPYQLVNVGRIVPTLTYKFEF